MKRNKAPTPKISQKQKPKSSKRKNNVESRKINQQTKLRNKRIEILKEGLKKRNTDFSRKLVDDKVSIKSLKCYSSYPSTKQNSRISTQEKKRKSESKIVKRINLKPEKLYFNKLLLPEKKEISEIIQIETKNFTKKKFYSNLLQANSSNKIPTFKEAQDIIYVLKSSKWKLKPDEIQIKKKKIDSEFRAEVLTWMSELCYEFEFQRGTYYSGIHYFDQFLLKSDDIAQVNYKMLAIAALSVSSKFEEVYIQNLLTYRKKADKYYEIWEIRRMEVKLLERLEYNIGGPNFNSVLVFLISKFDQYVFSNKLKLKTGKKNISPLFLDENTETNGLLLLIFQFNDLVILDDEFYLYNPFKLVLAEIYIVLLMSLASDFSQANFQKNCQNKNDYVTKILNNAKHKEFTVFFDKFLEKLCKKKMGDLFKYVKFLSNFVFIDFSTEKINEMRSKGKSIEEVKKLQLPISKENYLKIIRFLKLREE